MSSDKSIEENLKQHIDTYINQLSEGHRLHRKIKFLLDIRGLLVVNKIRGDYVEFGIYRGEMMYAAAKILSLYINKYIGLDTFHGLPKPYKEDAKNFVFEGEGFMAASRNVAEKMMSGFKTTFIEGDFRYKEVQEKFKAEVSKISVMTLDCNWPSSVKAAMDISAPFLQNGSLVFNDDFFIGTRYQNFNNPIIKDISKRYGLKFVEFMTYPPSGRAFIVEKRDT